jgi:hypothetical protein
VQKRERAVWLYIQAVWGEMGRASVFASLVYSHVSCFFIIWGNLRHPCEGRRAL